MAEISSSDTVKKQNSGVVVTKKRSTRVDLTPMVDLGFLLITFFIFTTTMSQPTAMKLVMPDDKGNAMATKEGGALTLLPANGGKVYYYEGQFENGKMKVTSFKGVRNLIIEKKKRTPKNDLFLIIKPTKTSVYRDLVNVLDEMTINDVERYAIVDISKVEEAIVK